MNRRVVIALGATVVLAVASGVGWALTRDDGAESPQAGGFPGLVPAPVSETPDPNVRFELTKDTGIRAAGEAAPVGEYLAGVLRPLTGLPLPVNQDRGEIALTLDATIGHAEGYRLDTTDGGVTIRAATNAGLFYGVQTLRQLLPPKSGPWIVPGGRIEDQPRYGYRGFMLDVARHFFKVADVKRLIDDIALYKMNRLHLHLTDDQGWRIAIASWPRLATFGGDSAVGGAAGGYYTQDEYRDIVAYAAARHITVVPEVDLPGHTNAALASYPELNCDGVAPDRFTGIDVGFSSLCVGAEVTYKFLDEVLGELAALTPGEYLHIGGDEAKSTGPAEYATIVNRAQEIVRKHGKKVIGWHELVNATPEPTTVAQFWAAEPDGAEAQALGKAPDTKLIMSPANHAYLDMKYTSSTKLGLRWAGLIEVRDAYDWDPAELVSGVGDERVLGVEAPLWTETVTTLDEIEYLVFPRVAAVAEVAWTPAAGRDWAGFAVRLADHGPRWAAMGIDFYRSPQIPWPD